MEFRRILLPVLVRVLDDADVHVETRRTTLCYLMYLVNDTELHQFAPRIMHPLMRLLTPKTDPTLQQAAVSALSCTLCRLGANFAPYIIPIRRKLRFVINKDGTQPYQVEEYEALVTRLLRLKSLPPEPASAVELAIGQDDKMRIRSVYFPTH